MAKTVKNVTTSLSLSPDTFNTLQKLARERKASVSALVTELVQKTIEEKNRRLAKQYQEAEQDPARKELIHELRALDDEGWPDE